jgi:hypothetical protein
VFFKKKHLFWKKRSLILSKLIPHLPEAQAIRASAGIGTFRWLIAQSGGLPRHPRAGPSASLDE